MPMDGKAVPFQAFCPVYIDRPETVSVDEEPLRKFAEPLMPPRSRWRQ